jgi:hypothetical protein
MKYFSTALTAFFLLTSTSFCQTKSVNVSIGIIYDARMFLSKTQTVSFNKLYPDFDSVKVVQQWEWKDVDPLGLFTPEQNKERRRELFLFEYNPKIVGTESPTTEQLAFKIVVTQRIEGAEILLDNSNIKIISSYTTFYEKDLPIKSLLEKLADLGFEWRQTGGQNLYIYNGNILLGKYKSGYVSLSDLNIDKPFRKFKRT